MTEEKAVVKRLPINIDFENGIIPKNYNELLQFSALLHKSGLVPKSLDTLEKVAIAAMMCVELGRPIASGIQDIAVINGKAGIFGDAALAIVRASGLLERFKEWEEGTPYTDDWTFYCEMKRKGMPDPRKGVWSWQDSTRAGFDKIGPPSPWAKYTRRMMQFKARNFPLRDEFGDVLKGMRLSEDNMDAIDMYPDAAGSYEKPKDVEDNAKTVIISPKPQVNNDFVTFVSDLDLPLKDVEAFVSATAEVNGLTEEKVKEEALKDQEGFANSLLNWKEQNAGQEEAQEVTLFDELKAMRPKTSDKNRGIFKDLVLTNVDEIRGWTENDLDYLRLKWSNTFPDEPFNDILEPPKETVIAETVFQAQEEQDRPPEPPEITDEPGHVPPWARRKNFLDAMKDLHTKNHDVYFNVLGGEGLESANDVAEDGEQEDRILAIMKEEIPG